LEIQLMTQDANENVPLRVRWVLGLDALKREGAAYDAFVERCGDAAVFYRLGWIESMVDAWGRGRFRGAGAGGASLAMLWAERDGRLVGVAPLQLEFKGWAHLKLRRLYFLGDEGGSLFHPCPDFLVADERDRRDCLAAFLDFLPRQRDIAWDLLDLGMILETSPSLPILDALLPGAARSEEPMRTALLRPASGAPDGFLAALASSTRHGLRRRERRLRERHPDACFSTSTDVSPERLKRLAEQHRQRQAGLRRKGRLHRRSLFDDSVERRALERGLAWAAREGLGRHDWLESGGALIAFSLALLSGKTHFGLLLTFADAYGEFAPTRLLTRALLDRAGREQLREVNYLPGLNGFKMEFSNVFLRHFRLWRTRPAAISRLKMAWWRAALAARAAWRRLTERIGHARKGRRDAPQESAMAQPRED
jgi:hypothetical protein